METTFAIVKPNAMKKNCVGAILKKFEDAGLTLRAARTEHLSKQLCAEFYAEHKARPFFPELVEFMSSHPVLLLALHGENAVLRAREVMGATNPSEAAPGTIRREFGDSVGENAVHGSDSSESARRELALFFRSSELI